MAREHGFDKIEYDKEESKKKADEDKKKAKKDEFDNDSDKDKDDNKSLDKRIKRIEEILNLR